MAHISGTFSNAAAGKLTVTLSGTFYQGTGRDAGFPSGASNMLIRPTVNGNAGPAIDRNAPTTSYELDYPGGSASWAVATDTLATVTSGTATYGFTELKMVLELRKK